MARSHALPFLKSLLLLSLAALFGCSAVQVAPKARVHQPQFEMDAFVVSDGTRLPYRKWEPKESPRGVLIALHGYNDYSNFIHDAAEFWCKARLITYAYDQRGFGDTSMRGEWEHYQYMVDDLKEVVRLARERHPGLPLYVLGESMGGAVTMVAMTDNDAPKVDGVILSAPAVWARETMAWYERFALWFVASTNPSYALKADGPENQEVVASDNADMLKAMHNDPKVLKRTTAKVLSGVTDLMDVAYARAERLSMHTLILYGKRDQIIRKDPTYAMFKRLPDSKRNCVLVYEEGYHLLLRDRQAKTVWSDVLAWIDGKAVSSSAESEGLKLMATLNPSFVVPNNPRPAIVPVAQPQWDAPLPRQVALAQTAGL